MSAIVSLRINQDALEALALLTAVERKLNLAVTTGDDGSWEFHFEDAGYAPAHAAVVEALKLSDPDWPSLVTVEYALVC